jgi:hypothetical protein
MRHREVEGKPTSEAPTRVLMTESPEVQGRTPPNFYTGSDVLDGDVEENLTASRRAYINRGQCVKCQWDLPTHPAEIVSTSKGAVLVPTIASNRVKKPRSLRVVALTYKEPTFKGSCRSFSAHFNQEAPIPTLPHNSSAAAQQLPCSRDKSIPAKVTSA